MSDFEQLVIFSPPSAPYVENRYKVNAKNTAEKQVRFDKAHLALSKHWAYPSDGGCTNNTHHI